MDLSDSDEEFFDAIDDTVQSSVPPPALPPQSSLRKPPPMPSSRLYKSDSFRPAETSLGDMSTGSTLSFRSRDAVSESRMLPFGLSFRRAAVRQHKKEFQEFSGLMLAQELLPSDPRSILSMKFSPDGRFLVFSSDSGAIYLHEVTRDRSEGQSLPLLQQRPYQEFRVHTEPVVDLAWAKSSMNFASAGLDHLVILWRVDSDLPLLRLTHPDMVTSVSFNVHNPALLATGCADSLVRVWNLAEGTEDARYKTEGLITAIGYSPASTSLFVGLQHGQVLVYESQPTTGRLKYTTTLSCRNRRGFKSRGRKVTGIEFFDESCALISTNDSRGRLFCDLTMKQKYKGHKSEENAIRLSFSHNLQHVVSGSETGAVLIWNVYSAYVPNINPKLTRLKEDRNCCYETFSPQEGSGAVLCAVFAPSKVVRDLQERGAALNRGEIVSHVLVTGTKDGVLRVFYNCHERVI